jgi:uncharacterized protein YhaN
MTTASNGHAIEVLAAEVHAFVTLMDERDRRYEERDRANKEAVRSALAAAEKAAEKTESALREYKVGSNEWRDTVTDLVSRMVTRPDVDRQFQVLEDKIGDLRESRSQVQGGTAQTARMVGYVVLAVALFTLVLKVWG